MPSKPCSGDVDVDVDVNIELAPHGMSSENRIRRPPYDSWGERAVEKKPPRCSLQ